MAQPGQDALGSSQSAATVRHQEFELDFLTLKHRKIAGKTGSRRFGLLRIKDQYGYQLQPQQPV